jgi:hypothetical protein
MSPMVITGNDMAYGRPVAGLMEEGPVVPRHPPSTLLQITKYLLVSNALPGPIMLSHQPGLPVSWLMPAAWASPENACSTRMALDLGGVQLAVGFVSHIHRRERGAVIERMESNRTVLASTIMVEDSYHSRADAAGRGPRPPGC